MNTSFNLVFSCLSRFLQPWTLCPVSCRSWWSVWTSPRSLLSFSRSSNVRQMTKSSRCDKHKKHKTYFSLPVTQLLILQWTGWRRGVKSWGTWPPSTPCWFSVWTCIWRSLRFFPKPQDLLSSPSFQLYSPTLSWLTPSLQLWPLWCHFWHFSTKKQPVSCPDSPHSSRGRWVFFTQIQMFNIDISKL